MPPSQFHKFVFLMMGLAWSLCRSKEDRKQWGSHPCSTEEWTGPPGSSRLSILCLEPGSRAVWQAGSHLLGEAQGGDPALLTTFIFSKIRTSGIYLMLKCTQAAYFSLAILHHLLYMLLGRKCSLF